jgi:hypothetical protein
MTDAIRQKVLRIMELALLLNPTKTEQDLTKSKPTVFVWQSGHVANICVTVHSDGWCSGIDADKRFDIPYAGDEYHSEEYIISSLDGCISYLEFLYIKWKDKVPTNEP